MTITPHEPTGRHPVTQQARTDARRADMAVIAAMRDLGWESAEHVEDAGDWRVDMRIGEGDPNAGRSVASSRHMAGAGQGGLAANFRGRFA